VPVAALSSCGRRRSEASDRCNASRCLRRHICIRPFALLAGLKIAARRTDCLRARVPLFVGPRGRGLEEEESHGMSVDRIMRRGSAGQGLVEYALIIALVAVVVIGTLILLGPQIASIFQNISNNL
jgi:pilus assembly protein Flp/PilA